MEAVAAALSERRFDDALAAALARWREAPSVAWSEIVCGIAPRADDALGRALAAPPRGRNSVKLRAHLRRCAPTSAPIHG
ncbi:MAG: hypothetical protein R3F59_15125 [Myxococcota bacterium]